MYKLRVYLFIETMLRYYHIIAETADTKEALGYLKNLEPLEWELGMPMIKSEYLQDRIVRLADIAHLNLFEVERINLHNYNEVTSHWAQYEQFMMKQQMKWKR